jgi:hypothetical protein
MPREGQARLSIPTTGVFLSCSRTSGCGDYYLVRVEQPGDPRGKSLLTSEYGVNLIGIHRALIDHQTTC